jgi:hypothetical protein
VSKTLRSRVKIAVDARLLTGLLKKQAGEEPFFFADPGFISDAVARKSLQTWVLHARRVARGPRATRERLLATKKLVDLFHAAESI